MASLIRRNGLFERAGVGKSNILGGKSHQSPRNVQRILPPALQHPRKPIERGICVGAAKGFMERGNDVVMFFAVFIVQEVGFLECLLQQIFRDFGTHRAGVFQDVERRSSVAVTHLRKEGDNIRLDFDFYLTKSAFGVGKRAFNECLEMLGRERVQDKNTTAGKERTANLKAGILGGGANKGDDPAFHEWQ